MQVYSKPTHIRLLKKPKGNVCRPTLIGRGERIRTSDSCVPNAVLYQAELHPAPQGRFPALSEKTKIAALRQSAPILTNIACILNREEKRWLRMPLQPRTWLAGG